jgi:hypothetical protein
VNQPKFVPLIYNRLFDLKKADCGWANKMARFANEWRYPQKAKTFAHQVSQEFCHF